MSILRKPTAPAAPSANAPSVPTAGAGAAGALFGVSGWLVAVVLLVALCQAKGCVPWPNAVKAGPRGVVLLHESSADTPAAGRLFTALRNPPHADYLTSKGHKLDILDVDSEDENGKPTKAVVEWRAALGGVKLPAVIVLDLASRKILDKRSVVPEDGADAIIGFLKAKGG